MQKKVNPLEVSCYVLGAGAFGVFFRWMQHMIAYNEEGLVDKSVWNVLVAGLIIASAVLYYLFIEKWRDKALYIPDDFCRALKNEGRLFSLSRYGVSLVVIIGALLLLATCETEKDADFLRVVAGGGILTGICFVFALTAANKPAVFNRSLASLLLFIPVVFYCIWLLDCYKANSINPVVWDFIIEMIALIVNIIAFFRLSGFAFGVSRPWRTVFWCMIGAMLSFTCLADNRNIGQQVMLAGTALMETFVIWILLSNMKQGIIEKEEVPDDGFERLK